MLTHSLFYASAMAVRTGIVLIFLVLGIRLFGRRQMGQLTIYDLVTIMLVANAVQNSMTAGLPLLSVGLGSSASLMVVGLAATYFVCRKPVLGRLVTGSPTVLVLNGAFQRRNMRRECITTNEVLAAAREHEVASIRQIHLAVLEPNGDISIVPKA